MRQSALDANLRRARFPCFEALRATCPGLGSRCQSSRGPRLKAQNLQPTKQMFVKLMLRLTT